MSNNMVAPTHVVHNAYSPREAADICARTGEHKAKMRADKIFISSVLGGAFLSFPGAVLITIESDPWFATNAPGIQKALGAIFFPMGLVMIVLSGTDLATGSFFYTAISTLHRRNSVYLMLQHWFLSFFGNLAGALFFVAILSGYGDWFGSEPFAKQAHTVANGKAVTPEWHQIFLRAIGANWLVCFACFLGSMGREFVSKVTGIWFPTFAFVCLGLDHVIANMFLIPISIFIGNPKITVGYYIWKSMIPAAIGNILGGALFTAVPFWYLYLVGEGPIAIDGVYHPSVDVDHGHDSNSDRTYGDPNGRSTKESHHVV